MTTVENQWVRVTRAKPCSLCGRTRWCSVSADGAVAICMRVESQKPTRNGGHLHRLVDRPPDRPRTPRVIWGAVKTPPPNLSLLAQSFREAMTPDRLRGLAADLGLQADSLTAFGVGWSAAHTAWSFPMTDPGTGLVTGIRLRRPDGSKFSVTGGKEALFLPAGEPPDADPLLVVEGPTDAIAARGIGFSNVAGRPSCTGGVRHIVDLVRSRKPPAVVIVADGDEPGRQGADALAVDLTLYARDVLVIAPPDGVKDVRAWVAAGATRPDFETLIRSADVRTLNLKINTTFVAPATERNP